MFRRSLSAIVFVIALWPALVPAQARSEAGMVVERLNTTLIEVMQNADRLGYKGRYDTLAPILVDSFNFPVMASKSVGRHWNGLDTDQKKTLTQVFARLSVANFASRFDGFSGESFQVTGEKDLRSGVLVLNQLVKRDGETISINYVLREYEGRWRIIDVYLDGKYSELALKRAEYSSVVAREGFSGLIGVMEDKIAEYAAGS